MHLTCKIISVFLLVICLLPFYNKQTAINQTDFVKQTDALSLDGKIFIRVKQDSLGRYFISEYCDAKTAKYYFKKDSICHNWGQETDYMHVVSKCTTNDTLLFEVSLMGSKEYRETIALKKLDTEGVFWRINDETFIDSIYSDTIPVVKENCDEYYAGEPQDDGKGDLYNLTQNAYLAFREYLFGNRKLYKDEERPAIAILKHGQNRTEAKPISDNHLYEISIDQISSIDISYNSQENVLFGTRGLTCVIFITLKE